MKMLGLIILAGLFANSAQASSCFTSAEESYQRILENDGYEFDAFTDISFTEAVSKIKESSEVEDVKAALEVISANGIELYVGYSSQAGGSGEEIVVVDKKSCQISQRIYTYVE